MVSPVVSAEVGGGVGCVGTVPGTVAGVGFDVGLSALVSGLVPGREVVSNTGFGFGRDVSGLAFGTVSATGLGLVVSRFGMVSRTGFCAAASQETMQRNNESKKVDLIKVAWSHINSHLSRKSIQRIIIKRFLDVLNAAVNLIWIDSESFTFYKYLAIPGYHFPYVFVLYGFDTLSALFDIPRGLATSRVLLRRCPPADTLSTC